MATNLGTVAAIGAGALALNAIASTINPSVVSITNRPRITFGGNNKQDYRAKLLVPDSYITQYAHGPIMGYGGIVFPYTPAITYEMTAAYGNTTIMHSNYAQHFYKNSVLGNFSVTAKFTVQNDQDAVYYLTTMHLLRALTKMQYGKDPNAGAPPPVCRFSAYGDFMIQNVPVVVSSLRTELPSDVDSYLIGQDNSSLSQSLGLGTNFIPAVSQITLTLIPMYSRQEQLGFSVLGDGKNPGYISGATLKQQGYL
jgi:hypothetical protein